MRAGKGFTEVASWVLGGIFILMIFFLVAFIMINMTSVFKVGLSKRTSELQSLSLLNRIVSSEECLGTGETGILSYRSLEEKDRTDLRECAYLPEMKYEVRVEGRGEEWRFGNVNFHGEDGYVLTYPVGIERDGSVKKGKVKVKSLFASDDITLASRKYATEAWVRGESLGGVKIREGKTLAFGRGSDNRKICLLEDETEKYCSKAKNLELEETGNEAWGGPISVTYRFTREGNKINIEVMNKWEG